MNISPKKILINTLVVALIITPSTLLHGMQSTQPAKSENKYVNAWTIGGTVAAIAFAAGGYWWWKSTQPIEQKRRNSLPRQESPHMPVFDTQPAQVNQQAQSAAVHSASANDQLALIHNAVQNSSTALVPSAALSMVGAQTQTAMIPVNHSSLIVPPTTYAAQPMQQQQSTSFLSPTSRISGAKSKPDHEEFFAAVSRGHQNEVVRLIEAHADINHQDDNGTSAAMIAAHTSNSEMLNILLLQHAKTKYRLYDSPYITNEYGNMVRAIEPANFALVDNNQQTALHFAVATGHLATVKTILGKLHSSEINHSNTNGMTPLHIAAKMGLAHLVKPLMDAKGDINAQTSTGEVPLVLARYNGHAHVINTLLPYRNKMDKEKYLHNKEAFEEEAFKWAAAQQEKMTMPPQSSLTPSSVKVEEVDDNSPHQQNLLK